MYKINEIIENDCRFLEVTILARVNQDQLVADIEDRVLGKKFSATLRILTINPLNQMVFNGVSQAAAITALRNAGIKGLRLAVTSSDEKLKEMPVKPAMCIVGEPTSMQVVTGHKGKRSFTVNVRGLESHSALAPYGVNAVEYAAELVTYLKKMARRIDGQGQKRALQNYPGL